jgi:hypothetical protein
MTSDRITGKKKVYFICTERKGELKKKSENPNEGVNLRAYIPL